MSSSRRHRQRDRRSSSPADRTPTQAQRQDYPPGPSDQANNAYRERSPIPMRRHQRPPVPEEENEDDYLDFEFGFVSEDSESDNSQYEPDDPPLPPGTRNRTTIGVELEFIVAGSRRYGFQPDPHPNDGRWLSEKLVSEDNDSAEFYYTVRNKIIDEIRSAGVVAVKTSEGIIRFRNERFEYWRSVEDEPDTHNAAAVLDGWRGRYTWDPSQDSANNIHNAAESLNEQFLDHHYNNNIEPRVTERAAVDAITSKIPGFLRGFAADDSDKVAAQWRLSAITDTEGAANALRREQEKEEDPHYVAVPGMNPLYHHWTCTYDSTVSLGFANSDRWEVPEECRSRQVLSPGLPDFPTGTIIPIGAPTPPGGEELTMPETEPPEDYKWFGAELRSPVLDFDHPETFPSLNKVCGAVRDAMRVHKPFSVVGNGFHVHFGQEGGWTLLQLKKFVTLWILVEEDLYRLHRQGREHDEWCKPVNSECQAALAIAGKIDNACLSGTGIPASIDHLQDMEQHVPSLSIEPTKRELIQEMWLYRTINQLCNGIAPDIMNGQTLAMRWRIYGKKRSSPPEEHVLQTIEIRMMQGTLDAEHIRRWVSICERMISFSRDSTPVEFWLAADQIALNESPVGIGFNADDLQWFGARKGLSGYFQYPDNDVVNWAEPFMTRGYGDTYT